MSDKLKVLVLASEPWRYDDGGGNTLNNFFEGMDAEFAQVYTSARLPNNKTCARYYQFTENGAVKSFLKRKPFGRVLNLEEEQEAQSPNTPQKASLIDKIKKIKIPLFRFLKEFAWKHSKWRTPELERFISDFNPDVVYAPCYASPFMLDLTKWVREITGKKIVTWSADDCYSLRQFSLAPSYWIKRFWTRHYLRREYCQYDVFFSASEDEAKELAHLVKGEIRILRKGAHLKDEFTPREVNSPIRMIYAGGIYNERWKTLAKIGEALKNINQDGVKMVLDIYTQNPRNDKQEKALNDGENIFCHSAVTTDELIKLYHQSDIALHVESMDIRNRLATRLSFSTKIIDCMESGCAIMAIAWGEQTGLKYLKNNDAAICIENLSDIESTLQNIATNPDLVKEYAEKAYKCAYKNNRIEDVQKMLFETFKACVR